MMRVGIDIGGTKVTIGLFDDSAKLVASSKLSTADLHNPTACLYNEISRLACECGSSMDELISCGVGIPGTVSADGKRIIKAPNLSALGEDFAADLEKALKIPVRLVQDSRAGAWGEYLFGGGKGAQSVVCITLGTGIGTGIVLDGKIYNGSLGCAGELGHIPVKLNGRPCGCGKFGCVEKYSAGRGLDITAAELLGEGSTAKELFEAAKSGNTAAGEKISEAVTMLGTVLISVVNLLSPDCILFSGGLSEQEELYLNPLIAFMESHCYMAERLPTIKKADLGELSPLYGAAYVI